MSLTIQSLSKTYSNGVRALDQISLSIPNGMYGLLGPNGAGKSTLMRILATLQKPDTGSVQLEDIDVLHNQGEVRKVLGYLPQDFGLYSKVKAHYLLNHFAILKGITSKKERNKTIEVLLRRTNLWDVRNQKVDGFSGGMRQRFGIAVALLGNPKLMIVDEPTAGLDPTERTRFLNVLSELGQNSVVILSTHIVEDVLELCPKMAIINKGEILLESEPAASINQLKGKIWARKVERDELKQIEDLHQIISTKLNAGKNVIRIYSDVNPGNDFEAMNPDLKDVYFLTIAEYQDQSVEQ